MNESFGICSGYAAPAGVRQGPALAFSEGPGKKSGTFLPYAVTVM